MSRFPISIGLLAGVFALVWATPAPAIEPELVDIIPEEKAGWSPRNLFAGLTMVVTGPSFWYRDKIALVETVPADAQLGIYFIRSNFQKRFERAVAPVRVKTPRRIHATSRDVVAVRASSPGFKTKEVKFRVYDVPEKLVIQLDPLPNALVFFGHTHLAGRSTIVLRTSEEPDLRVMRPRGSKAFTLALAQTADKLESRPQFSGGHIEKMSLDQVGEDVVISLRTDAPDLDVRSKTSFDPIRKEHAYVLDIMERGVRAPSAMQVRGEIDRVSYSRGGCDEAFAGVLRERLDPSALARAFRPGGGLAEFYQREAMLRLGRLNSGTVTTLSGEPLRTGSPIELAIALQSAPTVRDYLGLLGAVARTRPEPAEFLRALIAPEMSPDDFRAVYDEALATRSACG